MPILLRSKIILLVRFLWSTDVLKSFLSFETQSFFSLSPFGPSANVLDQVRKRYKRPTMMAIEKSQKPVGGLSGREMVDVTCRLAVVLLWFRWSCQRTAETLQSTTHCICAER